MILKESVIICCLGALLGLLPAKLYAKIIITHDPNFAGGDDIRDLVSGMVLGLIAGILGALYPAYKAARMDPVRALSFE